MSNSPIQFIYKKIHFIIPLVFLLLFGFTKKVNSPYDRLIESDIGGYYAYLPAIFIYNDFTFDFTSKISEKYYVDGHATKSEFINYYKAQPVNKYWIGLSILWFPFFLIAHFLSLLLAFPDDGYNAIYQFCIGSSTSVYLIFGIYHFRKLLTFFIKKSNVVLLTIISFFFGSNLFYYSVVSPCLSHAYTFTLFSVFLSLLLNYKFKLNFKTAHFCGLLFVGSMVVLIRPINILLLIVSIFALIPKRQIPALLSGFLVLNSELILTCILCFTLFFLQFYVWHLQTGLWFVDSYSGENFNFNNTHFWDFLISYSKGWLLYTPICLFSIAGIFVFYRNKLLKMLVTYCLLFVWIFVLSSWWIWTYGTPFGQRVMIDIYPLLSIFFGVAISAITGWKFIVSQLIIYFIIFLNIFQSWQVKNGYLPSFFVTKDIYWQSFLSLQKKSFQLYNKQLLLNSKINYYKVVESKFISCSKLDSNTKTSVSDLNLYSAVLKDKVESNFIYGIKKVLISCAINVSNKHTETALVFDISRNKKSVFYRSFKLYDYALENTFVPMNFLMDVPDNLLKTDSIAIYLFSNKPMHDTTVMKSLKIQYLDLQKDE